MRFSYQLLVILVLGVPLGAPAQENSHFFADGARSMIAGNVLDATGQVAEAARVCISVTSGDLNTGMTTEFTCPISADKYGEFQLEHLKVGAYRVFAQDAADHSSMEAEEGQKVTLTATAPYAHVTLRLKPGGILLGSVTDAVSGKPVEQFQVQYVELDQQGGGTTFGQHGNFRVVVPVATDLVVIVTAPGYKGWVYTDSENSSRPTLRLASGEQNELEIQLDPLPPASANDHGNSASPSQ